jgi:hypothetical protein
MGFGFEIPPQYFTLCQKKTLDYLFDNQLFVDLVPPQYLFKKKLKITFLKRLLS